MGNPAGQRISIHAPRTGSDDEMLEDTDNLRDFNPRSPHGERLEKAIEEGNNPQFQSTLPARGATLRRYLYGYQQ